MNLIPIIGYKLNNKKFVGSIVGPDWIIATIVEM